MTYDLETLSRAFIEHIKYHHAGVINATDQPADKPAPNTKEPHDQTQNQEPQAAGQSLHLLQPAVHPQPPVVPMRVRAGTQPVDQPAGDDAADACPSEERMRGWSHKEYISHVTGAWDIVEHLRAKLAAEYDTRCRIQTEMKAERDDLRAKLAEAEKDRDMERGHNVLLKDDIERADANAKRACAERDAIAKQNADREHHIAEMSAECERLTRELQAEQTGAEYTAKRNADLATERDEFKRQWDTARDYHTKAQAKCAELELLIGNAKVIEAQRDDLLREQSDRFASAVHHDSLMGQLRVAKSERDKALERVKQEQASAARDRKEMAESGLEIAAQRDKALAELDASRARHQECADSANLRWREIERLRADLAAEQTAHANTGARCAALGHTLDAARAEADALRAERDALKARKVTLPQKADDVNGSLIWASGYNRGITECTLAIRAAGVEVVDA